METLSERALEEKGLKWKRSKKKDYGRIEIMLLDDPLRVETSYENVNGE